MKKFYAVQNGSNFDWDNGSKNYEEAIEMTSELVADHNYDGEEIRIAVIDVDNNFCDDEIIIREGNRV